MFSSVTDKWNTPQNILKAVTEVLGAIDLDPCSNSHEVPNVTATKHYTEEDDGMKYPWNGRVFMNPPYGEPQHPCKKNKAGDYVCKKKACERRGYHIDDYIPGVRDWTEKFLNEYKNGNMTAGIALIRNSTGTQWFQEFDGCYCCFLRGRLKFNDSKNSAPFDSCLIYVGPNPEKFVQVFKEHGMVWRSCVTKPPEQRLYKLLIRGYDKKSTLANKIELLNRYRTQYITNPDSPTTSPTTSHPHETNRCPPLETYDAPETYTVSERIDSEETTPTMGGQKCSTVIFDECTEFWNNHIKPNIDEIDKKYSDQPNTSDVPGFTIVTGESIPEHIMTTTSQPQNKETPPTNPPQPKHHNLRGRRLHKYGVDRVVNALTEMGYTVDRINHTILAVTSRAGIYYIGVRAKRSATWYEQGGQYEYGIDEDAFRDFDAYARDKGAKMLIAFYNATTDEIHYETLRGMKHNTRTSMFRGKPIWFVPCKTLRPLKDKTGEHIPKEIGKPNIYSIGYQEN